LSLEPRTRALVIAGAGIFLTGAIPLDMVASKVFDTYGHRDTIQYATAAMIKESVEMIGSLVCLYAFTGYLTRYLRVQTIRIALSSR
jgi:hypothetical protein